MLVLRAAWRHRWLRYLAVAMVASVPLGLAERWVSSQAVWVQEHVYAGWGVDTSVLFLLCIAVLGIYPTLQRPDVSTTASVRDAENTISQLVETFCKSVEAKDPYTRGHSERVTAYILFLAEKVYPGLSDGDWRRLRYAGLLHDIGKIHVPEHILNKPAQLVTEEFMLMRKHPQIGADMIAHIPSLSGTIPIILHHHERYDGHGYPARLKGAEIPLDARIAALADTFDAMTSSRSYRRALTLDEALQEVIINSGTQFDPALVSIFVSEYDGLRRIFHQLHAAQVPTAN